MVRSMRLTRWLYLRALGVSTLVAVGSFWAQLDGLIGSHGITPAAQVLANARAGGLGFFDLPTLCWLSSSDAMLHALAAACVVLSLLLIAGVAPRLVLALLWLGWLSLVQVGSPWLSFQWDVLLLEALALSIPFAPAGLRPREPEQPEPSGWSRFLLAFLAFKVTFSSGVVKLASGDPSWRDLTALSYHWWTQPLPTWTSYLAAQWPMAVNKLCCALTFLLELPVAIGALGPKWARRVAAGGMVTLQLTLGLAGNYSYYNLLAAALAVPLLDDEALRLMVPKRWKLPRWEPRPATAPGWVLGLARLPSAALKRVAAWPGWEPLARRSGWALAAAVAAYSVVFFLSPASLGAVGEHLSSFATVNRYGAFAWMTKTRPEIVIEGSDDGQTWKPYAFDYKPGPVEVRPKWVAPWQPRLDWQMWFAAMRPCGNDAWFISFLRTLLQGDRAVLGLMGPDPFPAHPPRLLRTQLYQYRFAPAGEKGMWWTRTLVGPYCRTVELGPGGELRVASQQ